jgi:hypothetical protein
MTAPCRVPMMKMMMMMILTVFVCELLSIFFVNLPLGVL